MIAEGQHLGYRKTGEMRGNWIARYYTKKHRRRFQALGAADDTAPSNGTHVLSFAEALQAAQTWFEGVSRADAHGVHIGPYTVEDAANAWLDKWRGSERSKATSQANVTHHILPTLGGIEVRKLTREQVEAWLNELPKKEPIKVQKHRDAVKAKNLPPSRRSKIVYDPTNPETQRRREDSANGYSMTFGRYSHAPTTIAKRTVKHHGKPFISLKEHRNRAPKDCQLQRQSGLSKPAHLISNCW